MSNKRNQIHVIGHINPDTDAIASAMGYAWLLQQQQDEDVIAARAGQLNPQTTWVLNRLGLEPPLLLSDASPRFESIMYRFDTTTPERPLREAWPIVNRTGGAAPVLNEDGTPYSLVTVVGLFGLLTADIPALSELPYVKEEDGILRASGVISRKKQLLPVDLGALEG